MQGYWVETLDLSLDSQKEEVLELLAENNLRLDQHLDHTCGIYNDQAHLIATGSAYGQTLRCLAVDPNHQGEGLLNQIVTHLQEWLFMRGRTHLFVYTEEKNWKFFQGLGFYLLARDQEGHVFLENQRQGFASYLKTLQDLVPETRAEDRIAAIVMNANPMTQGHLALIQTALAENEWVYVFVLSDDQSFFSDHVRMDLVKESTQTMAGVCVLPTDQYLISQATFPSYFQADDTSVIRSQAGLDVNLFLQIADVLGIQRRYVGTEPNSRVTAIYNEVMAEVLADQDLDLVVLPRKETSDRVISASTLRQALVDDDWATVEAMATPATLTYLESPSGRGVIEALRQADSVIHE